MFKRPVAILSCAALLTMLASPAAQAQDPELESFGAGASATALFLSLLDQELTFSSTSAAVGSTPEAAADGQAAVTPLFSSPGAPVESTGALVEGEDCVLDENLPAPIDLAGLAIACVRTSAEVADGSPEGTSTSDEIELEVISAELVGELSDTLLRPLLEQLLAGLEPLLAQLGQVGPSLDLVIDLLLADLEDGGALATVTVAPTSSTASEVASLATAQGADIELLPGLIPGAGPLATVTVGDSFASATYNPETGDVETDGQAAFLSVDLTGLELVLNALIGQVGAVIIDQLPAPLDEVLQGIVDQIVALVTDLDTQVEELVNVTVDQLACPDSPLAALLCFTAGSVNQLDQAGLESYGFDAFGADTSGVESTILGLSVLDGTIELGIGQTAAGANAVAAEPVTPSSPETPVQRGLPTTGADDMMPLALALFAAATIGLTLVRRTRSV